MRKAIVFFILIFLCAGFAGSLSAGNYGIKAGVKFPGETDIDERAHDGCPVFGVTYSFDISETKALQVEMLYFREVITIYQNIGTVKKDYLELPVLLIFKNRTYSRLRPELFIGASYIMQFREEWGGRSGNFDLERCLCLTGGVSFDIETKFGAFVFDARANTALIKTWGGEVFMGFKTGFAFTVGFRFGRQ